jgi:threonyl-tRNA synthetase
MRRFIGILTEHYAGAIPRSGSPPSRWRLFTITDRADEKAAQFLGQLK